MVERRSIPSVFLQERIVDSLFQINGLTPDLPNDLLKDYGFDSFPETGKSCRGEDSLLMWNGPGMCLFEAEALASSDTLSSLRKLFESSDVTITDLSSARTIVRISGASRRDLLKKGCPADIDSMVEGDVVLSLIGHLAATIHCGPDYFDAYVLQSFGTEFWEWCRTNVREFNI